jgi:hypothetical protein
MLQLQGTRMLACRRQTLARLLAIASLPVLCSMPTAWAQQPDRPLLLPQSDVAVVYRFEKMPLDGPQKLLVTYSEAGQRVRIDYFHWMEAKVPYLALIFDRPANREITLIPEHRAYNERPVDNLDNPGEFLGPDLNLTRLGNAMVAQAPCTEWQVEAPGKKNDQDTACVTRDGIVLRLASKRPSAASMTAISIRYGSPPDGIFDPPPGFKRGRSS